MPPSESLGNSRLAPVGGLSAKRLRARLATRILSFTSVMMTGLHGLAAALVLLLIRTQRRYITPAPERTRLSHIRPQRPTLARISLQWISPGLGRSDLQ